MIEAPRDLGFTGLDPVLDAALRDFVTSADRHRLDEAITVAEGLCQSAQTPSEIDNVTLTVAALLIVRGQLAGGVPDFARATQLARDIRAGRRLSPEDDAAARAILCGALMETGRRQEPPGYLEEVLELTSRPAAGTPGTVVVSLANYRAAALTVRYQRDRDPADLHKAIRLLRKYLRTSPEPRLRSALSTNLAGALLAEYERTSDEHALEEALGLTADAVATLRQHHPGEGLDGSTARALCARSMALCTRWRYNRNADHLDEAFELMDLVLEQLEEDSPVWSEALLSAASVWDEMGSAEEDLEMIDIALDLYGQALEVLVPDTLLHRIAANGAASALAARFELAREADDVDVALELLQVAAKGSATPELRSTFDHNVAVLMVDRFLAYGRPGDLDEAIQMHERSLGRLSENVDRDRMSIRTAAAYYLRYRERGREQDLVRSKALLSEATHAPRSAVGRLASAKLLADIASGVGDWATCADAAELALDGVESALGALDIARWSDWLSLAQGLASLGSIAAIQLQDLPRAVSLVERGCGVMAAARISQQRTSLKQARAAGHGVLVDAYERAAEGARRALARTRYPVGGDLIAMADSGQQTADALQALSTARGALMRVTDNLSPAADLGELLAFVTETGDELVYLMATEVGGASLQLRPPATPGRAPTITAVLLPKLTAEAAVDLAIKIHAPSEDPAEQEGATPALAATVRGVTTGPTAAEVADVIGQLTGALAPLPKSWHGSPRLVAAGVLSLLPIEAACRVAPDRAVSLGMAGSGLIHLTAHRNEDRTRSAVDLVAVTNPRPCHWLGEELPSLRCADDEAAFLSSRFAAEIRSGPDATAAAVKAVLERDALAVLHISAHGWTSEDDPDLVELLLADGPDGSAQSIAIEDLPTYLRCQSVFLACCWLARTGTGMPDEAIGFPTTLIQAGAARVVAPLWPVDDYAAYCFVIAFYAQLLGSGAPARVAVARARDELHRRADTDPDLLPSERAELRATADAFVLIGS